MGDESLSCLPVYLSGCAKLLVLCGDTYLQRLWCVIELFVFFEMGGLQSDLEILHVACDDEAEGSKKLEAAAQLFEPLAARCSTDFDTLRLQEVIAASGQGREGIKQLICESFTSKGRGTSGREL